MDLTTLILARKSSGGSSSSTDPIFIRGTGEKSIMAPSATEASGDYSYAEGGNTTASGNSAHAEGYQTFATGFYSHAEGHKTNATTIASHAEGSETTASGLYSHAEGIHTTASGDNSHAEGRYTVANKALQHVFGEYNIKDPSTAASSSRGTYVEIVGNGITNFTRSNARTLDWNGNEWLAGDLTVNVNNTEHTIASLIERIAALEPQPSTYGFDMDLSNSDPSGCVTYVEANAEFQPAHMDYTNDVFDYGDWENVFFMPKPCMLSFAGEVENYLDPIDYTKNIDGTDSAVATSTTANAMMEWPVIWVKRWESEGIYHFRCSSNQFDDAAQCFANINDAGDIVNFYTPIYFGSLDSNGKLRSLSGGTNYISTDTAAERTAAAANGAGWEIERMVDWLLINDLLVLISKTRDSQTAFGNGVCNASAAIGQGTMNNKGLFYGKSDGVSGVKVFGMENWYGNIYRRFVGWMLVNGVQKIKLTTGTQDGSTVVGYNITGNDYIELTNSTPSRTNGGYVNANKVTEYGLIPITASGSATTYSCDGLYFNNSGTKLAYVGGDWGSSARVGASCAALNRGPGDALAGIGAAPSYK